MRGFQPAKSKAKPFANGGPVRGPGTGTSDQVPDEVPNGTYIMPADSTQAVGEQQLATMGSTPRGFAPGQRKVPVQLSNGEYKLPPDQVHAIGVQALDNMKNATHAPVPARGFVPGQGGEAPEPRMFFVNGGAVDDEQKRLNNFGDAAAAATNPGVTQITTPAPAPAPVPAASAAPSPSNTFPGNSTQGTSGSTGAPLAAPATAPAPAPAPAATAADPQAQADRAAIGSAWNTAKDVSNDAGRAIADVATLVPRAVVGAYDSAVVRPMRAAGLDAAYLSPKLVPDGVDPASMTPFTDQKRMQQPSAAPAPTPGQVPLPSGVSPSIAGSGRGLLNPPMANPNAPVPTVASAAPAAAPAGPQANQVMPGVYRSGNSYSDSAAGAVAGAQPRGLPSAQNMAAADAMAQRQEAAALQAPRGFAPAVPQFAAPQVNTSANDWETRNNLRNLEVSASSITNNGGRYDSRRGRISGPSVAQANFQDAARADLTARGLQPSLENSTNQINSYLAREGMQQEGSNLRNDADNRIRGAEVAARGFVARNRLALDQAKQAEESQVRGFEIRDATRREKLTDRYEAAKTTEEKAAVAQQIRDLSGKQTESPWKVQVTPATKNVDGSTTEGSIYRYNTQTGQVQRADAGEGQRTSGPTTITNDAAGKQKFASLPPGAEFVGPDGKTYKKT